MMHASAHRGSGVDRAAQLAEILALASERIEIAVVGAHLHAMPLNYQLNSGGGWLVASAKTASDYRFHALSGTGSIKPRLVRATGFEGPGIEREIGSLDPAAFGRFVAAITGSLGGGTLTLDNGWQVTGLLCQPASIEDAEEITHHGGWSLSAGEKPRLIRAWIGSRPIRAKLHSR